MQRPPEPNGGSGWVWINSGYRSGRVWIKSGYPTPCRTLIWYYRFLFPWNTSVPWNIHVWKMKTKNQAFITNQFVNVPSSFYSLIEGRNPLLPSPAWKEREAACAVSGSATFHMIFPDVAHSDNKINSKWIGNKRISVRSRQREKNCFYLFIHEWHTRNANGCLCGSSAAYVQIRVSSRLYQRALPKSVA